jgi:hypothetical protein
MSSLAIAENNVKKLFRYFDKTGQSSTAASGHVIADRCNQEPPFFEEPAGRLV